tara:strand:- start:7 stop:168 length:162 start_codon:yes stop_codon:yes gene_type:complete
VNNERKKLVTERDAADRRLILANEIYVAAIRALNVAALGANKAAVAVYNFDAA